MPARGDPTRRRREILVVLATAYALAAAATTPFSPWADVVTGVAIVAVSVVAVCRWPARPEPVRPRSHGGHPFFAWAVLLAVLVAFELAEYLAPGGRGAHPTLSSMADAVDRRYPLKALVFFGWLCLGAGIVHLGTTGRVAALPETDGP